jgi:Flp pilus assembly protein TadG
MSPQPAKTSERGSVAVECALSIPLLVLLLLVVIQFMLLCVERQLMNYTAFMAARSRMVRADGAYQKLAKKIVPWAKAQVDATDPNHVKMHVWGHKAIFTLTDSPLGPQYQLKTNLPIFPHVQTHGPHEDNPIICAGGQPC